MGSQRVGHGLETEHTCREAKRVYKKAGILLLGIFAERQRAQFTVITAASRPCLLFLSLVPTAVTVLNTAVRTSSRKGVCTLRRTPSTPGKTLHYFFFFSEDSCPFQNVIFPFLFLDRKAKAV